MDRSGFWCNLTGCWEVVSASLTPLGQLNLRQYLPASWPSFSAQQELSIRGRRFGVLRLLGEGGYSFVYLVKELPTPQRPQVSNRQYALKKVLIGSEEQLAAAQREIDVMRRLRHPNLMPLLGAGIGEEATPGGPRRVAHMLFPLYEAGSLWDLVQSRLGQGTPLALAELLSIFIQVCAALQAMHSMEPPLAHRDVKPHNVLLRQRPSGVEAQQRAQQAWARPGSGGLWGKKSGGTGPGYSPLPALGLGPTEEAEEGGVWGELELQEVHGSGGGSGSMAAVGTEGQELAGGAREGRGEGVGEFEAVLMDFGSTKPARVEVFNRMEAMAVQEDAEAHCTAPYRAPELWDVPSSCSLDERVDVWSAGCLLYFMLAGESPFERVVNEAGGSLLLAVVNGRVSWPPEWSARCPQEVKDIVTACLTPDPAARPFIPEVKLRAEQALAQLLAGQGL